MRTTITTTVETPMSCKELAQALRVNVWFVYKMRGAGFAMTWNAEMRCTAATPTQARQWIERTKFRIVRGGVQKGCKKRGL